MRKAIVLSIFALMLAAPLVPTAKAGVKTGQDGFLSSLFGDKKTQKRLKKSARKTVKSWSKTARKGSKRADKAFRKKMKRLGKSF